MSLRNVWKRKLVLAVALLAALAGGSSASLAETTSERALRTGTLTIGFANNPPWGFRGPDGEASGYSPDLVRAAFAPLGINKLEVVVVETGALIPALNANRLDIIAQGLGINPQRCQAAIFSEPDLAVGDAVLVAKGNPLNIHSYADVVANPKIRLGAGRGSSNSQNALDSGVPSSQLTLYQDHPSGVAALIAGRIDAYTASTGSIIAIMQSENMMQGLERATPFQGLLNANGEPVLNYAALVFRPTDTDLRDLYNKRLIEMRKDGTLAKIMTKYGFSPKEEMPSEKVTTEQLCAGRS